jgi:hypothetical protein
MAQVICEVAPGLGDSEKTVTVRDIYGRRQFLRVEEGFLALADEKWYLPIGIVGIDSAKQLALVELPHESDGGISRLWVRLANLREVEWPLVFDEVGEERSLADQLEHYREVLSRIVEDYASHKPSHGEIDTEAIVDRKKDHYAVMNVGWDKGRRVHGCVIHLDIINGKIWIQYDGTNRPVADELLAAGVPHEDIVLGFQPPRVRPHTDFAVG